MNFGQRLSALMVAISGAACSNYGEDTSPRDRAQALIASSTVIAQTPAPDPSSPPPDPAESAGPIYATVDAPMVVKAPSGRAVTIVPGNAVDRSRPPRLITVLHALCTEAEENCRFLREIADRRAILVCPTGNGVCPGGAPTWTGAPAALSEDIAASLGVAEAVLGEPTDPDRGDVLFGSSRGAYVARDVLNAGKEKRWRALVLVGGNIELEPAVVRRAGIRRVLLAAPDFDPAAPTMRRTQSYLCRGGIPARFVSLGPHGHGMVDDSPTILAKNMDWVTDPNETEECRPTPDKRRRAPPE